MSASDSEQDSCARAASAAIEVVREECGGMDVEVREVEDGMLMEMPTEVAGMLDDVNSSTITFSEFANFVDDSEFIRNWLGGVAASREVAVDPTREDFAAEVTTLAGTIFDEPFGFSPEEMRGTETLEMIAEAASE